MHHDRRAFVRHPAALPVGLSLAATNAEPRRASASDVGHGGVCLRVAEEIPLGTPVVLTIPVLDRSWRFEARVVWVTSRDDGWDLGLCFVGGEERTRARLVEQICQIEAYHQRETARGRALDREDAASEWARRNASSFPEF